MTTATTTRGMTSRAPSGFGTAGTSRSVRYDPVSWWREDVSEIENTMLVAKLERLHDEPVVTFPSAREAVNYLRSRIKRSR